MKTQTNENENGNERENIAERFLYTSTNWAALQLIAVEKVLTDLCRYGLYIMYSTEQLIHMHNDSKQSGVWEQEVAETATIFYKLKLQLAKGERYIRLQRILQITGHACLIRIWPYTEPKTDSAGLK